MKGGVNDICLFMKIQLFMNLYIDNSIILDYKCKYKDLERRNNGRD